MELVIIWTDGTRNIYDYDTYDDAKEGYSNLYMAFGEQINWYCIRPKR